MPGIHVFSTLAATQDVDGRNKSGHDERIRFSNLGSHAKPNAAPSGLCRDSLRWPRFADSCVILPSRTRDVVLKKE
jgi:hypothetical protein